VLARGPGTANANPRRITRLLAAASAINLGSSRNSCLGRKLDSWRTGFGDDAFYYVCRATRITTSTLLWATIPMRAMRLLTTVLIGSALVVASASVSRSQQEYLSTSEAPPSPVWTSAVPLSQPVVGGAESAASTTNTVLWRQYQALHAGGPAGEFQHCSGAGSAGYDRCGCGQGYFPWFNGPGRWDQWCIGPKWSVKADGLLLFRDPAALGLLTGAAGDVFSFQEQFDMGRAHGCS